MSGAASIARLTLQRPLAPGRPDQLVYVVKSGDRPGESLAERVDHRARRLGGKIADQSCTSLQTSNHDRGLALKYRTSCIERCRPSSS